MPWAIGFTASRPQYHCLAWVRERKGRSLVVCPTGLPLSSPSSLVYPGGPSHPLRPKARLLPLSAHTRAAPSSRTAPVCQQGLSPKPLLHFLPVRPRPARHRRPAPVRSLRNGRDGVCVSPRAAAATRQESASPPPELGERWRPLRRTRGHALAWTVTTERAPPRLPPRGRVRPRRQISLTGVSVVMTTCMDDTRSGMP